jgi:hypothetical protein
MSGPQRCCSQSWRRELPAYATLGTRVSVVDKDGAAPSTERAEPIQSTSGLMSTWYGLAVRYAGCETAMGTRQGQMPLTLMSAATDRRIVSLLVRARMSLRRQRRDNSFYHRLVETGRNPRRALESELTALLPPRREWPRPGLPIRRPAREHGTDAVSTSLVDWVISQFGTPTESSPDWLKLLRRFVGNVRRRVRDWGPDSTFERPTIYALLKARASEAGRPDTFRCLAVYNLSDSLVISIAARHLRQVTDSAMHPGSLAFRTKSPPLTHHDAVERILRFRRDNDGAETWVSEIDIRGFFDVVSHSVARRSVATLLDRLPADTRPDPRALTILDAYLDSYAFNTFGRKTALEQARKQQRLGHDVEVPWPESELKALGVDTENDVVGIPQGGALSCFLANAILDHADRAVQSRSESPGERSGVLYLRYCDDIICIATRREQCQRMMDAYTAALKNLRLPAHKPLVFDRPYEGARERTDGGFWKGKSKAPYRWAAAGPPGSVPWCAFVGYQVRFDGVLRIRPSSIKKEIEKHNRIVSQVKHFIRRHGQTKSRRQIIYRVRQRLRAIAVGTGTVGNGGQPPPFSWARGFRLMGAHASQTGQLRDLDRHRVACVSGLRRRLEPKGKRRKGARPLPALRFEGFPYSYAGLAERQQMRTDTKG